MAREDTGERRLIIDMTYLTPKFTFVGSWTGRDVITVRNLLRREYLRYQQAFRREAMTTAPTTQEVTL